MPWSGPPGAAARWRVPRQEDQVSRCGTGVWRARSGASSFLQAGAPGQTTGRVPRIHAEPDYRSDAPQRQRRMHGYGQISPACDSSGSRSHRATLVRLAWVPSRALVQSARVGCKRKDRVADSASRQPARHQRPLHQGFRSSSAGSNAADASGRGRVGEESSSSPAEEFERQVVNYWQHVAGEVAERLKAAVC